MTETMTLDEAASFTHDQVELMTVGRLTHLHNVLAPACHVKPIKKFETKAQGQKRVLPMIQLVAKSIAAAQKQVDAASAKPVTPARAPGQRKASVSSRCRELILAGRTNEQVWAVVQAEFKLPDRKKHYPAWNRAALIRAGQLVKGV